MKQWRHVHGAFITRCRLGGRVCVVPAAERKADKLPSSHMQRPALSRIDTRPPQETPRLEPTSPPSRGCLPTKQEIARDYQNAQVQVAFYLGEHSAVGQAVHHFIIS